MLNPNVNRIPDGLGYRAILGVLVPYTNTIVQPEYEAFRPVGVTNHTARVEPTAASPSGYGDMESYRKRLQRGTDHIKKGIDELLPAEPHAIILGHSIDTFRGGVAGAAAMKADLEKHAGGVPVILPSHAFLAALATLKVGRRLAALTPYHPPADEQVESFFKDAGFDVLRVKGLKRPRPAEIAATPRDMVVTAVQQLAALKPDAILQVGTNLAGSHLAAELSSSLGMPVISCNTATYWHALRALGIKDRMRGFGPLMSDY